MKDAVEGSLLLNIVVIFTSIVILFFAGIMAYSKAYKIKNRIIEVVERYEVYDDTTIVKTDADGNNFTVPQLLEEDLRKAGYIVATSAQVESKCGTRNKNTSEYLCCVYEKSCNERCTNSAECTLGECIGQRHYEVVTFIHFDFPVIGNMLTFEVHGETKMLGKNYDY